MLCFQLLWVTFHAKNLVRSATSITALSKSCTEAIMRVPQIITYGVVEKAMKHKGEQR